MIRPDVLDRFAEAFEKNGFNRKAFIPSYGMAEVCLAITFSPHGAGVRTEPAPMATDDGRRTRRFVLCGKVLPGHRLEVRDDAGKVLGDREVGRIFVSRAQHHAGLLRRARGLARGAVRTVGSTPAISATRSPAKSSSPAAPRT